ncbi:hypothetical protein Poly30_12900 [Planctomycetes bacterium Poly30]|uniref:Uncharacterized protein n=1 Tax=Saltatorellus ferox TaxID=2528018 RepID=A0A518ENY1_9BACT|nr:hypothetical protein Poly30_12900 [Planctomycetes bacterium Poly30]
MKHLLVSSILFSAPALANEVVIPNQAPSTAGSGGYSTLLHGMPRSYQVVIGPEELMSVPAGSTITGITWRRPTWISYSDWPGSGSTCSWTNYDIYLSQSQNAAGSLSTTYTDNLGPDLTLVRSGPISLSGAYFPGGAVSPQVNAFGMMLPFSTPYVYQGGDLLLTVRHDGNSCGSNASLDTVPSAFTQAIGVSSYTQPDSWYGQGLIVMKLEFSEPTGPGTNYCMANNTSLGAPAVMGASGSQTLADNELTLEASGLPPFSFAFFITSQTQAFVANPAGSAGNLCLSGSVGRYVGPGQIQQAGTAGTIALAVNLGMIPQPNGFVSAMVNETWNFQAWFRDTGSTGTPTSNFTDGLAITFL